MPQWDGTPVLKALLQSGWALGAPLDATYRELSGPHHTVCREVRFKSHDWRGRPVRIFGYYAYPKTRNGRVPGLLIVHGGGGYATLDRVTEAAAQGYAALSIDLPGGGTLREGKSRSTGPDMTVRQLFTVKPDLCDNYIYNAVLAQMRAISFLRTRPEVDPSRIGLMGVSWGGATGLITTSLDRRITCFVNIYGAGLLWDGSTWHDYLRKLPEGEFRLWEANFDPSRYVPDIRVPVLGVTGTNDNCYYLHRFLRTLRAIQPTPDLVLRPNLDHKIDDTARSACFRWLAVKLKGDHAKAPPRLAGLKIEATARGARVSVQAGGQVAVRRAEVCYGPVGDVGWTNREWRTVKCSPDRYAAWWSADIPLPTQITYAFASVQFADGSLLSTPASDPDHLRLRERAVRRWFAPEHAGAFGCDGGHRRQEPGAGRALHVRRLVLSGSPRAGQFRRRARGSVARRSGSAVSGRQPGAAQPTPPGRSMLCGPARCLRAAWRRRGIP